MDTVDGFDISSLQGNIDFKKAATEAAGPNRPAMRFCYIKSSQYTNTRDIKFHAYKEQATEAGLYVGAYHFIAVMGDPGDQAAMFYDACEGQGSRVGELPPMLDFEYVTKTAPEQAVEWVERFALAVDNLWFPDSHIVRTTLGAEALGHCKAILSHNGQPALRQPLVYTYPHFAAKMQPFMSKSILTNLPLCMAFYGAQMGPWYPNVDAQRPPLAKGWDDWKLWQYSGNKGLKVPGVLPDCDRLLFNGSEDDLREFAGLPRTATSGGDNVCKA